MEPNHTLHKYMELNQKIDILTSGVAWTAAMPPKSNANSPFILKAEMLRWHCNHPLWNILF